ncbi:origin recognition complex subunit 4 [Geosmithia morbida]|uniref:Origin recognition complex subunit 4 n=1 Tax=Geosmithia morbida TaxID=1094350 RepID=A0A9P4Z319_9HYPO|nr:origin recognition complex subunit 4 [Geosmithia morbida]KAF4126532.1 origin recognition complex subunit 4 [Geosmithia morbida]
MATPSEATTPGGHKRPQPRGDTTPAGTEVAGAPSAKKRKVDDEEMPTPPGFNSLTAALSNGPGDGHDKPHHVAVPSVGGGGGSTQSPAGTPNKARPAIKLAALRGTVWDNDPKPRLMASPSPRKRASASASKTKTTGGTPRGRPPKSVTDSPSKPRSVGRPKGSTSKPKPTLPPPVSDDNKNDDGDDSATDTAGATPQKQMPAKRLWGTPSALTPKGILSPSKNRNQTPKTVKFGGKAGGGGGEIFFEDLPKSSGKKTTKTTTTTTATPRKEKQQRSVVIDEIRCGMCNKTNSRKPNQIVLCDNCDFAVHQQCYGLDEIPEGDWLCSSCSQEDALATAKEGAAAGAPSTGTASAERAEVPDIPNLEKHLRLLQRVLLDRCAGRRRIDMFGLQEVQDKTRQIIEQTVVAGEGNSMLLIGARGSGKTTLLESIIADVSKEHSQDFHVVRLNGFIHTDDKLALKEIWRQLGKEMDVEDDLVNRTNYADTMASLLALLSHPSEILGTDEGVTSQSIIFIIDEFDMFAAHPRQTLLYNLFDVAQSRKAPIAVLGCTTRLNVVETLEKRVKSRFSHRYVYLTMPRSLPAYWQVCRQGLVVERKDAAREGIDTSLEGYSEFHKYWNSKIDELYKQKAFQELLQYHYYTTKSAAAFFEEWILPLSVLSPADMAIKIPSIASEATSLTAPDSRMHLLSTLSDLDLGLLIAAARLDIVAHTDTVNFAMAYDEYSSLVGRQRVQSSASGMLAVGGGVRVWGRGVAGTAWERLISLGLLVPSGVGGGRGMGYGGLEGRMWKVDVALEEIPLATKLGTVLAKWCREI